MELTLTGVPRVGGDEPLEQHRADVIEQAKQWQH